jgi:N-acyl-D-amino-acid deacylase
VIGARTSSVSSVSFVLSVSSVPVAIAVAVAAVVAAGQPSAPAYATILRRGTIVDGSGGRPYQADIGIQNGHIARIGNLSGERAALEIDVSGLFVTPGFINIHSHAIPGALATAENMLTQGVTTEILNPDGGGAIDLRQQLSEATRSGLAVNIGGYIGFNSIWSEVMGPANRRPTPDEIVRMRGLITDGLAAGAWGVSAGLDYKPAYYAEIEEVVRVVDAAGPWRTNFPNHDRLTPESNFSSRAGVGETIAIGEKTGLVPVVTHMKAQGHEQGSAGALLAMMQAATARGHYTAADVYPYLSGQTGLGALIVPPWAQDGGREEMLKRFKDPAQRARIVAESEEAMRLRFGGANGILLPATGRLLTDIMREEQASAGETVLRILERENPSAILPFGSEADLVKFLQHPNTAVACDCGATTNPRSHPRAFGSFPRVLGRYVRDTHALTWADAVRKMTALPATMIGMVDRGFMATGMAADVTVFDPVTVIDRATYDDAAQLSEGIRYVLVNGVVALANGKVTGVQAGRVLIRTAHMPSRPMTTTAARRLALKGTINATVRVDIEVSQAAGAPRARGSFRLQDSGTNTVLESTELGTLQTSPGWASFTARIRNRATSGEGLATVIVERADPFVAGRPPTVLVDVDTVLSVSGALREAASAIEIKN